MTQLELNVVLKLTKQCRNRLDYISVTDLPLRAVYNLH